MTNEDIANKGDARKILTKFVGFASAVLVPKYDARLIEAAFYAKQRFDLQKGITYNFRLLIGSTTKKGVFEAQKRN